MNKSIEVDFEEALPLVSLREDPCVHRLVEELHDHTPCPIEISIIPTFKDGIDTYRIEIFYDDIYLSELSLRALVSSIGHNLQQRYKHAYWIIYWHLDSSQKTYLIKGIRSIPGVSFAFIDQVGFLCVEYRSVEDDLEARLNAYLDKFFDTMNLEGT